jgi:hypothetical protein
MRGKVNLACALKNFICTPGFDFPAVKIVYEVQLHTRHFGNSFLILQKKLGKTVVGYGAAAKGNTMLNYAGVRSDLVSYVVDRNPSKQGKWLPGSRIPILDEGQLRKTKPDYILILPWNLQKEIVQQLSYVREWGAKFVVAQPEFSEI